MLGVLFKDTTPLNMNKLLALKSPGSYIDSTHGLKLG
jgi:hypothetical protein